MESITDILNTSVRRVFADFDGVIELTRPDSQFGDFSTNVAMKLAAAMGTNPREIGEAIAAELRTHNTITKVVVAGPGFINITVHHSYYQSVLKQIVEKDETFGQNNLYKDQTVLTEYSDPNPLKPLHAGHLYTTLVGDAIARIIEWSGAKVTRINYGGDVGLHVGKSMWAILQELEGENPDRLANIPESDRPTWLGAMYVRGNTAYEDDNQAKEQIIGINQRVYALHAQNDTSSNFAHIYWTCRQWSYDYFKELYNKLQIVPFDRVIPESEVTPLGVETVHQQLQNGVYQKSDGAVVFRGDDHGLHTRVFINSAGLPTYEAKDVGLLLTKWRDYHFDTSIVITSIEQAQYMEVMLKSVAQFDPEPARRSKHLTHGFVKLAGGVKMSSRKGNTIMAMDILESAAAASKEATGKDDQSAVLAAVKYAFLRQRISGADIIYDSKESVSILGNSGPYLQYAHARAASIVRAGGPDYSAVFEHSLTDGEYALARKLSHFEDAVLDAAKELSPHTICTYLYELCQEFNRFYEHNKVIGDPRQQERLTLVRAYTIVLRNGLSMLGISAPDKM